MAKKKALQNQLTPEEEETLNSVALNAPIDEENVLMSIAELNGGDPDVEQNNPEEEPHTASPLWHDFVMKHFEADEKDSEGSPYVAGLRRVSALLIGPILSSKATVVASPSIMADNRLTPAVVEYVVRFLSIRLAAQHNIETPLEVEYGDCADVYYANTDPEFARFATAVASTRAEARALRKALGLKRCAAEEKTLVPVEQFDNPNGNIKDSQINFIDMNAQRANIDVLKFISMGKKKYNSIDDVSYDTAAKMCETISSYITDPKKIPDGIKGYVSEWRETN